MLLSVQKLSKTYGPVTVLSDVTFTLNQHERAGLVGANGAGKSTLLRILTGLQLADAGGIVLGPSVEIGYLPQTTPEFAGETLDDLVRESAGSLRRLEARMRGLEAAMSAAREDELTALLNEYGQVSTRFQDRGGYELDHRIAAVLAGLRLDYLARDRAVHTLSGGERARAGVAALLLRQPDLLLLDEPTNHLDAATLDWLEGYLAAYDGGVLVVSHDRAFLNRAVNRIFELDDATHTLRRYDGDYDTYAAAKAAERAKWEDDYERQQEEIAALRHRVRETARQVAHNRPPTDNDKVAKNFFRGRVETSISRNVRSAEERLARIEADPVPKPPKPLRFQPRFESETVQARAVLVADRLSKRLGGRDILREVSFSIGPRARIALIGPNGAGKTTLLRLLLGLERPDAGTVRRTPAAQIGYLPQEPLVPDPDRTVLDAYKDGLTGPEGNLVAGILGNGLFRLDDLPKKAGHLSIGQRRKLEIARMVAARPNVLVLDEPTNYVSLDVLDAFEAAVFAFPGPVLAVSHDRWFLRRFEGEVWELRDGQLIVHSPGEADKTGTDIDAETGAEVTPAVL